MRNSDGTTGMSEYYDDRDKAYRLEKELIAERVYSASLEAEISFLEDRYEDAKRILDNVWKLYEKRCEETATDYTDGEEMFLSDLSDILLGDYDHINVKKPNEWPTYEDRKRGRNV